MDVPGLLVSYLFGSFQTAYLVGKLNGIDLRKIGSGNLGGTNVYRALGWKWALPVIIVDISKGVIPVLLFGSVWHGFAAVVGHAFSIFIGFRGGKSVGTTLGSLAGYSLISGNLCPLAVFLAAFLNVAVLGRIISLASLTAVLSSSVAMYFTDPQTFPAMLSILVLVYFLHRGNIQRLIKGEEKRLERVMK